MLERRRYVRVPENSRISYKRVPAKTISDYLSKDISQGGIRFLVHEFIPKDSYLKVRLEFSKSIAAFEAMVRLVWIRALPHSEDYEVGVEFMDMPPHAAQHLISYIKDFFRPKDR